MKKGFTVLINLVHGMVVATLIMLAMLSSHEDLLFDQFVESFTESQMSDEQRVLAIVDNTHRIMHENFKRIGKKPARSTMQSLFPSVHTNMVSPKGHCGSFAIVLGRFLQRADFPVRVAQMDCSNGMRSCHIFVEVEVNGTWVPVDAMYNVSFRTSSGNLATSKQVSENWEIYSKQLPKEYPLYFDYGSVRYTNWQKIPLLMPLLRSTIQMFIGDQVEKISLRSYILNVYKFNAVVLLLAYILFLLALTYASRRALKSKKQADVTYGSYTKPQRDSVL